MHLRLISVDAIDRLLPQTQCQRCGYPACRPYAQALADGQTEPNRCPPGGQAGADALADLIGQPRLPLDLSRGESGVPLQARIIEALCIGCTKCIRACPVDAIIGGNKRLHHVIADRCTGCALCLPPCPTDCIEMVPRPDSTWDSSHATLARKRYEARKRRVDEATIAPQGRSSAVQKAMEAARQRLAQRPTRPEK